VGLAMSNVTLQACTTTSGLREKGEGKKEKKNNKERKIVHCTLRICVGHIASKIWIVASVKVNARGDER
jgi:hypothetical protein